MCKELDYNKRLTSEDLMEELRLSGSVKVNINKDTGLMEQLLDDVYMAPGYGETEESISCNSYELEIRKEDMHINEIEKLFYTITDYPKHNSQVDATGDKEIIELDINDYNCAIGFDWQLKNKDAGLIRKEYSKFDKLMFLINKARTLVDINKLWDNSRYMSLSIIQERSVDRLCQLRINAAKEASNVKFYERMFNGAYTVKALLTTAKKIRNIMMSESSKNWLRAVYKIRLYQINRNSGWKYAFLTKRA